MLCLADTVITYHLQADIKYFIEDTARGSVRECDVGYAAGLVTPSVTCRRDVTLAGDRSSPVDNVVTAAAAAAAAAIG